MPGLPDPLPSPRAGEGAGEGGRLNLFQEAERQLTVCNACRYCEGYCAVIPYLAMALPSLALSVFFLAVVWGGLVRLVTEAHGSLRGLGDWRAWAGAVRDALSLRQLGGGGEGCYYPDRDRPSPTRRVLHS